MLKLKTAQFRILTRSHTSDTPPASLEELVAVALSLRGRVDLPPFTRYRLVGVGLAGFRDEKERENASHAITFRFVIGIIRNLRRCGEDENIFNVFIRFQYEIQ